MHVEEICRRPLKEKSTGPVFEGKNKEATKGTGKESHKEEPIHTQSMEEGKKTSK